MAIEIERKYLVKNDLYKAMAHSCSHILQAYLARFDRGVVRVRIRDNEAFITVKSRNTGVSRNEWEYEIPVSDARDMIDKISDGKLIDKTRYLVEYDGLIWEIDEFHGTLEGLVVAEVELSDENINVELPPFVGREVTGERRFYNSVLLEIKTLKDLDMASDAETD